MPLYGERRPPAALDRYIECGWYLQTSTPAYQHAVPPDGCIDIVYERGVGLRAVGTMTRQQDFRFDEPSQLAGIRFRPGVARQFLGISPTELTDRTAVLETRWARELNARLDCTESIEEVSRLLLRYLPTVQTLTPVQRAIEHLAASNGTAGLDLTASHSSLSLRHFRRLCVAETGVSPKQLCRILRFRHASHLAAQKSATNWCSIAADAGYFDQAHLIHDFREFTGRTPMAVFSNTEFAEAR
jgi:AraC-like DNA-binding protein